MSAKYLYLKHAWSNGYFHRWQKSGWETKLQSLLSNQNVCDQKERKFNSGSIWSAATKKKEDKIKVSLTVATCSFIFHT
jgi:hypothetical protein